MAERPRIDITRLHALTREARSEPERRRREAEAEGDRRRDEEAEREAAAIIAEIPSKLEAAARRGEDHATVLVASVEGGSYFRWRTGMTWQGRLMGAAKIVYDFCVAQGLRVEEREWASAKAEDHGFELIVFWIPDDSPRVPGQRCTGA